MRRKLHHAALSSQACRLASVTDAALGRSSDSQATYLLQLPSAWLNQCLIRSVRSCYRCGAVPDSNRIPF